MSRLKIEEGYLLITVNTDDQPQRERRLIELLRTRKVDGMLLVVAPDPAGGGDHIRPLLETGVPVVFMDRVPFGLPVDAVAVDNRGAARMCVRHLVGMGHRRIGCLSGSPALQTARERQLGYEDVLREYDLPIDPALIASGDFRADSGHRVTKAMCLSRNAPTALFATNGMMGMGALKALRELRIRCPEDVALAVFDDLPFAELSDPTVTAVAQPAYELGRRAGEVLIGRIRGTLKETAPVHIELEAELRVRASTQFPRRP